jgi:hypothetical protein
MKLLHHFLVVYLCLVSYLLVGQIDIKKRVREEIKWGNYEVAIRIIALNRNNSFLNTEDKEELQNLQVRAKSLLQMRWDALTYVRAQKYQAAQKKYEEILRINPTDQTTSANLKDLRDMANQPTDRLLDMPLNESKKYYDKGVGSGTFTLSEREKFIQAAIRILEVNSGGRIGYRKLEAQARLDATKIFFAGYFEIQKNLVNNQPKIAKTKADELIKRFPEAEPMITQVFEKLKDNKQGRDELIAILRNQYNTINYEEAKKTIKSIRDIKGYENDKEAIDYLRKINQIDYARSTLYGFLQQPSGKSVEIQEEYDKIFILNPNDKNDYYNFVFERLVNAIRNDANCDQISSYGRTLLKIDDARAKKDAVEGKIKDCENRMTCREKCQKIYVPAYRTLYGMFQKAEFTGLLEKIQRDILDKRSEISTCTQCDTLIEAAEKLRGAVIIKEAKMACIDTAKVRFKIAKELREQATIDAPRNGYAYQALNVIQSIDTSCCEDLVDLLLNIRTEVSRIEYTLTRDKAKWFEEDEELRSNKNFENEKISKYFELLGEAKKSALDLVDSREITRLFDERCCFYNQSCCPKNNLIEMNVRGDSTAFRKLGFTAGLGPMWGNITTDVQKYRLTSGRYLHFGVRYQKVNFLKHFDWGIGATIGLKGFKVENVVTKIKSDYFTLNNVEVPMFFKYHTKRKYQSDARWYSILGIIPGKGWNSKGDSFSSYQNDITSITNGIYFLGNVGIGIEVQSKKELSLGIEITYNYGGIFDNHNQWTLPFKSSWDLQRINFAIYCSFPSFLEKKHKTK